MRCFFSLGQNSPLRLRPRRDYGAVVARGGECCCSDPGRPVAPLLGEAQQLDVFPARPGHVAEGTRGCLPHDLSASTNTGAAARGCTRLPEPGRAR
ncbi:hypothetical protein NDU88_007070 [Pleurodeles waltl]|uniref:Uncharacterized protein n=1 Tax=Pleurodeles waltl TaxID=8319 RepID=A0AAV7U0D9_PLEWA|nr:hypothetical protein NDU88_007070 [Pleurodeles waltl]